MFIAANLVNVVFKHLWPDKYKQHTNFFLCVSDRPSSWHVYSLQSYVVITLDSDEYT